MNVTISPTSEESGALAARMVATHLRQVLARRPEARIVVATGTSQFHMLQSLLFEPGIDWERVVGFHLDEYIGIDADHPASFCRYLRERFVAHVPLKRFHFVDGTAEPHGECQRLAELILAQPIDVACIGIGENAHLAFNDPPADFETRQPYLVVKLDEACRRQQAGEGWFPTLDDVPRQAISMSIRQIMASQVIVCTVPDERKALAVQMAVEGPVTPEVPASILQTHAHVGLFLDRAAASRLGPPSNWR